MALQVLIVLLICLSGFSTSFAEKWSYSGDSGPLYWHQLFPDACSGLHQSPINIKAEQTLYDPNLKEFAIWYDPPKPDSKMYIKNNGHTVKVDLEGEFYVTNAGLPHVYKAAQFHFHWGNMAHFGSEHTMEGTASPIEMHLVTYNHDVYAGIGDAVTEKGGLAVLGVMFEVSKEDNPVFDDIVTALKHIRDPDAKTRLSLPLMSLRDMLPDDISRYYRYNGSLTTPGCFESVTWTVFDQKQTLSHKQLRQFRKLLQFRRHHNKQHKEHADGAEGHVKEDNHGRHKRSLTDAERKAEHRAEQIREELGIKDDSFEESVLKAKLLLQKQEGMLGDQPKSSGNQGQNAHSRRSMGETDISKLEAGAKYDTMEPTQKVEVGFTQEILVNNYRPVQPLNNRLVYRSFKLREPAMSEAEESHAGHSKSADHHHDHDSHQHPHDGVGAAATSLVTVIAAAIISVLFTSR